MTVQTVRQTIDEPTSPQMLFADPRLAVQKTLQRAAVRGLGRPDSPPAHCRDSRAATAGRRAVHRSRRNGSGGARHSDRPWRRAWQGAAHRTQGQLRSAPGEELSGSVALNHGSGRYSSVNSSHRDGPHFGLSKGRFLLTPHRIARVVVACPCAQITYCIWSPPWKRNDMARAR
jgi:hypothetical protein